MPTLEKVIRKYCGKDCLPRAVCNIPVVINEFDMEQVPLIDFVPKYNTDSGQVDESTTRKEQAHLSQASVIDCSSQETMMMIFHMLDAKAYNGVTQRAFNKIYNLSRTGSALYRSALMGRQRQNPEKYTSHIWHLKRVLTDYQDS